MEVVLSVSPAWQWWQWWHWVPVPLLCSILRHPEVLLGRDALPEAALLVLMHPQGKGRDEDTDVVPELTEKKKIRWNTRLLLQFLLKWETRSV